MASTLKTENYALNQWVGTDKPQRTDFNSDNSIIDSVIHSHISDMSLHTSPEDKKQNEVLAYLGDGSAKQVIELEMAPDAVIVMPLGKTIAEQKNSITRCYSAAGTNTMAGSGVSIAGKNVTVKQEASYTGATSLQCLNEMGITYIIIALRSNQE